MCARLIQTAYQHVVHNSQQVSGAARRQNGDPTRLSPSNKLCSPFNLESLTVETQRLSFPLNLLKESAKNVYKNHTMNGYCMYLQQCRCILNTNKKKRLWLLRICENSIFITTVSVYCTQHADISQPGYSVITLHKKDIIEQEHSLYSVCSYVLVNIIKYTKTLTKSVQLLNFTHKKDNMIFSFACELK